MYFEFIYIGFLKQNILNVFIKRNNLDLLELRYKVNYGQYDGEFFRL